MSICVILAKGRAEYVRESTAHWHEERLIIEWIGIAEHARSTDRKKERKEKIGGRRNKSDGPREVGCTEGGTETNKGREREREGEKQRDG